MTVRILHKLETQVGDRFYCVKCGKQFQPKDRVVSLPRNNRTKYYHEECFESTLH